jgi:hypothetical protein
MARFSMTGSSKADSSKTDSSKIRGARGVAVVAIAFGMAIGLTACNEAEKQLDKAKTEVGEFAIRNGAAIAGTEAFKDNGYELAAKLDCTADVTKDNDATVSCTGTTKDGKAATLEGTADGDNLDKGTFVGKVDGQEVFSKDSLTDK